MKIENHEDFYLNDYCTPVSKLYDDIYFSNNGGIEESKYVFLKHNFIGERIHQNANFKIGELGFGTGLNFLTTILFLSKECSFNNYFEYHSFEKHPLSSKQINECLSGIHELENLLNDFLFNYQKLLSEKESKINFQYKNANIYIYLGDALSNLFELNLNIDAWYLDGFSPQKNPDLWSKEIMTEVKKNSTEEATFSTYTASSNVKRTMLELDFELKKAKGFAHKREMTYGKIYKT